MKHWGKIVIEIVILPLSNYWNVFVISISVYFQSFFSLSLLQYILKSSFCEGHMILR